MEREQQRLSVLRRAGMAAVLLGALAPAANAQTSSLAGSVVDRYGVVVSRAPVEARNTVTGAIYRTFASDQANYELRRLPAGTYDVSVNLIGFRHTAERMSLWHRARRSVWTYRWRTARR